MRLRLGYALRSVLGSTDFSSAFTLLRYKHKKVSPDSTRSRTDFIVTRISQSPIDVTLTDLIPALRFLL